MSHQKLIIHINNIPKWCVNRTSTRKQATDHSWLQNSEMMSESNIHTHKQWPFMTTEFWNDVRIEHPHKNKQGTIHDSRILKWCLNLVSTDIRTTLLASYVVKIPKRCLNLQAHGPLASTIAKSWPLTLSLPKLYSSLCPHTVSAWGYSTHLSHELMWTLKKKKKKGQKRR